MSAIHYKCRTILICPHIRPMNGQVLISIPNVSYVHQKSSVGVVSLNWRISCLQCLLVSMKVESVGLKTEDISNRVQIMAWYHWCIKVSAARKQGLQRNLLTSTGYNNSIQIWSLQLNSSVYHCSYTRDSKIRQRGSNHIHSLWAASQMHSSIHRAKEGNKSSWKTTANNFNASGFRVLDCGFRVKGVLRNVKLVIE